jgi:glutamate dehydrogenase
MLWIGVSSFRNIVKLMFLQYLTPCNSSLNRFAQQLKNKDIPEGGSKAVTLSDTNGLSQSGKNFVMRKSVKAFTDTILDLVVDTPKTQATIVNLLGKKEVLYLGPDEQVIPVDINWIIKQAAHRGYGTPAAFMSSKPSILI